MPDTTIVIPCYNEAARLDIDRLVRFATDDPPCRLLLVDDGSRDDTLSVLNELQECDPRCFDVLALETNRGKAEAVRRGVLAALDKNPKYVGYWDADLATPLEAIATMRDKLTRDQQLQVIFGSRVRMLGRNIQRNPLRHLLGRAFATAAALTLGLGVYDTQCGAKLFRAGHTTRALFEKPFLANWIFDVELIARMLATCGDQAAVAAAIYEMPLEQWQDVAGSKVRPRDFCRALFELVAIYRAYLRRIPAAAKGPAAPVKSMPSETAPAEAAAVEAVEPARPVAVARDTAQVV